MADEWADFNLRAPKSSDDEWAAFNPKAAPPQEGQQPSRRVDDAFSALNGEGVPRAFLDRVATGGVLLRDALDYSADGWKKVFDYSKHLGELAGRAAVEGPIAQAKSIASRF